MRVAREAYERYLHSPAWKAKRLDALDRAGHRCAGCTATDALQVHHLTYERLGFERLTDLMVLCEQCHALEHGQSMRAGMPLAGPTVNDFTHQARANEGLRRRAAGQGRDMRNAAFVEKQVAERAARRAAKDQD